MGPLPRNPFRTGTASDTYDIDFETGIRLKVILEAKFAVDYERISGRVYASVELLDVNFTDMRGNDITAGVKERHAEAYEAACKYAKQYLADDAVQAAGAYR